MKRRRGFVQMAILHLLHEQAMHGYEMIKQLELRSNGIYKASAGTIYPALQDLLDRDLIELQMETPKKVYALNARGEHYLQEMMQARGIDDFWGEWLERMKWRNSPEFSSLKGALERWEKELHSAMKMVRGDEQKTAQLVSFLEEVSIEIRKQMKR